MTTQILKVHGSGNTFYLIEGTDDLQYNWFELGAWLCDKQRFDGADGLLVVLPSEKTDAKMRVINADGSEASMCGNGLRCVARYVLNKLQVDEALIETMKADLHVSRAGSLATDVDAFSVEIAPVSFDLQTLPMVYNGQQTLIDEIVPAFSNELRFSALSIPNPHLIALVTQESIDDPTQQQELATMLNQENDFTPDGVNVSYVLPLSQHEIFVRTFERGVGFTNACGTAMTASSLVASKLHVVNSELITVYNPGGFVRCHVEQHGLETKLALIGNATFTSEFILNHTDETYELQRTKVTEEQVLYDAMIHDVYKNLSIEW
ncbi:diaminopimelate epimerase [Kurthia sibirica]|uniref:Diaminopimelate epimerase n=1 Tax=Kurthia sibirica TaxID=202750 RepID=A0A2U3APD1_9BACL|nr:diaminopimelate epimerase [Kurthia sibirica]PWI26366.1 diaminopimelate epimerase [Kurthia sibirica]GEK34868.1 diaminopimelate epimerase [Kurthia sibirica]